MALDIAALEEKAYNQRLEEICEMQDRAISALRNALEATQLALNLIEKNRQEQGYKQQIQWQPNQPYQVYPGQVIYTSEYFPYTTPSIPYSGGYAGNSQLGQAYGGQLGQLGQAQNLQPSSQEKYEYDKIKTDILAKAAQQIQVDWNVAKDNVDVSEDIPPF